MITSGSKISDELIQYDMHILGNWQKSKYPNVRNWKGIIECYYNIYSVSMLLIENKIVWCKSSTKNLFNNSIDLFLGSYDQEWGKITNVVFSICGAQTGRGVNIELCPSFPKSLIYKTGCLNRFCNLSEKPKIEIWFIAIYASDIIMKRNRVWHLKKGLDESIVEPYSQIFSKGRCGSFNI